MAKRRIDDPTGIAAVRAAVAALQPGSTTPADLPRTELATAVRWLLQALEDRAPGRTVEVRVPPFGAVQIIEGPVHTRGTPPNVIEIAPEAFIALATGSRSWQDAQGSGEVRASGGRASLERLLPVHRVG